MIFSADEMQAIAPQLRRPEGEKGKEMGKMMAQNNNEAIAFTLECLDVRAKDHVLEIGFGPGEGIAQTVLLTPEGFVCGIDFSQVMLEMAQERNHKALMQEAVELSLGDANALPYEDGSFTKIFAVNVFHFWQDPSKELSECLRVLEPEGRAAFFMAYPSSWKPGLRESGVFVAREPQDVMNELDKAGFINVQSNTFTAGEFKGFVAMGERQ